MVIFKRYIDSKDCVWYDSSNLVYSECVEKDGGLNSLRIVFKQGRTYLYRDVALEDYIMLRDSESNGKAFNQYIKKYDCVRLPDTDLSVLEETKKKWMVEAGILEDERKGTTYMVRANLNNGETELLMNGEVVYSCIEDHANMQKLLAAMNINYKFEEIEDGKEED